MFGVIFKGVLLFAMCSTALSGMLYLMVASCPKEISLAPVALVGKPLGPALFAASLVLAVVCAVLSWKVASGIKRAAAALR